MCPAYSQCLQAQNRQNQYLCCKSTESQRVCPRNQVSRNSDKIYSNIRCLFQRTGCASEAKWSTGDLHWSGIALQSGKSRIRSFIVKRVNLSKLILVNSRKPQMDGFAVASHQQLCSVRTVEKLTSKNLVLFSNISKTERICAKYRSGKTFQCNPLVYPSECPAGYECSSSNVPSVNVCCRREPSSPTSVTPQTPTEPITFRSHACII